MDEKDKYKLFPGLQPDRNDCGGKLSPAAAAVLTTLSVHTCLSLSLFILPIPPSVFLFFCRFILRLSALRPFYKLSCFFFLSPFFPSVFVVPHFPFSQTSKSVWYVGYLFGYFHFKIYAKLHKARSSEETVRLSVKGLWLPLHKCFYVPVVDLFQSLFMDLFIYLFYRQHFNIFIKYKTPGIEC